jgi:hypothetical protein
MNLKHRLDVNGISSAMLLEESEQDYLGMLEVGSGIVRLQNRMTKPFLVKFPRYEVKKGLVTDEKIRRLMSWHSANSVNSSPDEKPKEDILPIREGDKSRENNIEITEDEKRLLVDVIEYPISGIAERYKRLSYSVYKGNKIRDSLISIDLLNMFCISTFEGRVNFLDLTEQSEKLLRENGHEVSRKREGGPEHEYWKQRVAELLKSNGFIVELESLIGEGKSVDILAVRDGQRLAIEIETGKSNVMDNIRKLCSSSFSEIWVVCLNEAARRQYLNAYKDMADACSYKIRVISPKELSSEQEFDPFNPQ